jgi:hypothetical protein
VWKALIRIEEIHEEFHRLTSKLAIDWSLEVTISLENGKRSDSTLLEPITASYLKKNLGMMNHCRYLCRPFPLPTVTSARKWEVCAIIQGLTDLEAKPQGRFIPPLPEDCLGPSPDPPGDW